MSSHWKRPTETTGALPPGTFGAFMARNRFDFICRTLHFSDNTAASSPSDRAWKLRPVIDVLQQKFKDSYVIGDRISFDEMMLPNRSRMSPIRQYCPMKPRKYGAKLFAACCPVEAFCSRYSSSVYGTLTQLVEKWSIGLCSNMATDVSLE